MEHPTKEKPKIAWEKVGLMILRILGNITSKKKIYKVLK
jgi:hypothetical protein